MDFGTLVIAPRHRHFSHFQFQVVGKVNDLRVKAPAVDLLERKDHPGRALRECLKTALRIVIRKSQHGPRKQVEGALHDLTLQGLPLKLQ